MINFIDSSGSHPGDTLVERQQIRSLSVFHSVHSLSAVCQQVNLKWWLFWCECLSTKRGWNRPTNFVSHRLLHGSSFQGNWAGLDSNWQAILLYSGFPFHFWRKNYLKRFCLNQNSLLPSSPFTMYQVWAWHLAWHMGNLQSRELIHLHKWRTSIYFNIA